MDIINVAILACHTEMVRVVLYLAVPKGYVISIDTNIVLENASKAVICYQIVSLLDKLAYIKH